MFREENTSPAFFAISSSCTTTEPLTIHLCFTGNLRRRLLAGCPSTQPDDRSDEQHYTHGDNCRLCSEHRRHTVLRNPAGLEISNREATAGAPHVDDGTDD